MPAPQPLPVHPGPLPPGWVRVDCHLHTVHSGDAVTTLDELAERVEACGLDVVCVTDHHVTKGAVAAAARGVGARIVVGEEIRTSAGELIGLFLTERIPYVLPVEEVVARIRAQRGVVYAPHPFDPVRAGVGARLGELAANGAVDVIEVFNAKMGEPEHNLRAVEAARRHDIAGAAGSDAHDPYGIGAAYVEMPDFDGPEDFVEKLRGARVVGELRDHAPRLRPRRDAPGGGVPAARGAPAGRDVRAGEEASTGVEAPAGGDAPAGAWSTTRKGRGSR